MDSHMYSICSSGALSGGLSTATGLARGAGPGTSGWPRPNARADPARNRGHPVHAPGGDRQLQRAPGERGAVANDVVLRRPWAVPDTEGYRAVRRESRLPLVRPLPPGRRPDATGPGFEWVDQFGEWHPASGYPLADAGTAPGTARNAAVVAGERRQLELRDGGDPVNGGIDVAVPGAGDGANLVGTPELELEYRAPGTRSSTRLRPGGGLDRDIVVGGQATPIPSSSTASRTPEPGLERSRARLARVQPAARARSFHGRVRPPARDREGGADARHAPPAAGRSPAGAPAAASVRPGCTPKFRAEVCDTARRRPRADSATRALRR